MGFSWEPLSTVKASSVVEMKNAVNTLTDLKTAPRFNWQQSTPVVGDMITAARYQDLQAAADYADNRNVCLSDKAAHYDTYKTSEYSVNDAAKDVNQDVTNNVTIYTAHDIGYDTTKYAQVDDDQNVTYNTAKDIGYDATKYAAVDSDQNVSYHATADAGYDAALYTNNDASQDSTNNANRDITYYGTKYGTIDSTKNITIYNSAKGAYHGADDTYDCGECFAGSSITINAEGMPVRVDKVKVGDYLLGTDGVANRVLGIEKSPSLTRTILCLDDMTTKFVGEHPFMMENGEWGAFNKELTDRGVANQRKTFVNANDKRYRVVVSAQNYNDDSVRQMENGTPIKTVSGTLLPINHFTTAEREDFIYTMLMDGDRTWNVGGYVTSGLALVGDDPRLEEVL